MLGPNAHTACGMPACSHCIASCLCSYNWSFSLNLENIISNNIYKIYALQTQRRGQERSLIFWVCWVNLYYPYIQCTKKHNRNISGPSIVKGSSILYAFTLTRPKRRRKIGNRLSMQPWQQRKWKPLMKCKKLLLPSPKTSQWEYKNWCLSKYLIFYYITIMHRITLGYWVTIFIHALCS